MDQLQPVSFAIVYTFVLIGRPNQMPVGRNQMVEMNRMVEGQSGKTDVMMTAEGWEGSSGHHKENEPRFVRPTTSRGGRMSKHNVLNVAIAETEKRVPFLVLDFSDVAPV